MKTFSQKPAEVEKKWLIIDAEDVVLGRMASRMLPGNRLSRVQMTHLRVFAGTEHGMEAQKPEVLDVASMNKKNTRTA